TISRSSTSPRSSLAPSRRSSRAASPLLPSSAASCLPRAAERAAEAARRVKSTSDPAERRTRPNGGGNQPVDPSTNSTLETPSTSGTEAGASVLDPARTGVERFRRFGLSLGFDAVGAVVDGGARRATWWHAPDAPAPPLRLDDG